MGICMCFSENNSDSENNKRKYAKDYIDKDTSNSHNLHLHVDKDAKFYILILNHYQDIIVYHTKFLTRDEASSHIVKFRREYIEDWLHKYHSENYSLHDIFMKEEELLNDMYFGVKVYEI